jgi:hypothetical protein
MNDRQKLALAKSRVALARAEFRRKTRGEDKVTGFMESRGWTDADVDRMLTSDKVLRAVVRDMENNDAH